MQAGDKVRLIANPGRIGILGNETDGPPGRERVLVTFLDGEEDFVLRGALEPVGPRSEGPYQLMQQGRYGRAKDLRGLITYYRLSGKLANLIYSLNTTNTDFYPYQFAPVLKFLDSPNHTLLIADEVGLGKTIEAGLIWTELRARQDARRLLVVCPAMLREKWRDELGMRFGVKAQIVDAKELLDGIQAARQQPLDEFAFVASLQGIRPPRGWDDEPNPVQSGAAKLARFLRDLAQADPVFDLIVIDEAHYLRNRGTQTHHLGELLRDVTQSLIMLSATPIQLGSGDLFNLVHLLDEDAFSDEWLFKWSLQANEPLVTLRDRVRRAVVPHDEFVMGLQSAAASPFLENSLQLNHLIENPPDAERLASSSGRAELADTLDRINPLGKIVTRTLKRDVQANRVERAPTIIKAKMSPVEAAFYAGVTETVREFCSELSMAEGFMLTIPQRQMASSMPAAYRGWTKGWGQPASGAIDEMVYELSDIADEGEDRKQQPKESGVLLSQLREIARDMGDFDALARNDSKYAVLKDNLVKYWRKYPGRKVVLFSFYRGTLYYLAERLLNDGFKSVVLHGGMDKQRRLEEFKRPDGANILLSSEVASEGVDLQFSSLLINYDLPWNPARIEQRIGRIDRIGQREPKVLIWNLVYEDTIDDRVYERLLERLDIFKHALGSMELVLGGEIRKLTHDLLSHSLTAEEERNHIDQARVAIETLSRRQEELEQEASNLIAHGKFIEEKVQAARDLGRYIRGADLLAYVRDFLLREYPGTRLLGSPDDSMRFRAELSVAARADFEAFIKLERLQGSTSLLSSTPPELRFDNQLQQHEAGVEVVTQDHPLVRFVTTQIRQTGGSPGYLAVSAVNLSKQDAAGLDSGIYVYVVMRWSFSGSRVIERLEYIGRSLGTGVRLESTDAEKLVNAAALNGRDWPGVVGDVNASSAASLQADCRIDLEDRFKEFVAAQQREDSDRIQLAIDLLEKRLVRIRDKSEELIAAYERSGDENRIRMIPAEKGRAESVSKKLRGRIAQFEQRRSTPTSQHSAVSAGVIQVD